MNSLKYFKEFIPSENYNLDNYFNSGVLAYQSEFLPKLEEMLKYMEQNLKIINSIYLKAKEADIRIGIDQTLLNLYSFVNEWNMTYLGPQFNLQRPTLRGNIHNLGSKTSIIHFNARNHLGLSEYINKIKI